MNCPSCGAPMRLKPGEDSFKCDFCQTVVFPEKNEEGVRVLGEPAGVACPVCNAPLVKAALAKVPIVYCTKCSGMLIPMPAFETLVDELEPAEGTALVEPSAESMDLRRKIGCPGCGRPMDAHFYAGPGHIVIDSCEDCSLIWLDHGKLMRLVLARKLDEA